MMGPLVTGLFLLLFSGNTVLGQNQNTPEKRCNSLVYLDSAHSDSIPAFKDNAYFSGNLVYTYNSNTQEAVPQPGWDNVEDWHQVSQLQKERGDFLLNNLDEIMTYYGDVNGSYILTGYLGCELCQHGATKGFWFYILDGTIFIEFDTKEVAWIPKEPAAVKIKQEWEKDPGAVQRTKDYLEKDCIKKLKEYRDYKKAN